MMTFLNPLDAPIPKIPFSFFADFWVRVTSETRGSVSVGFWGSLLLFFVDGTQNCLHAAFEHGPPAAIQTPDPSGPGV